jgi:outer membrane protein assembly factor BamB
LPAQSCLKGPAGVTPLCVAERLAGSTSSGDTNQPQGRRSFPARAHPVVETEPGYGAIRAYDPKNANRVWEYKLQEKPWSGLLSTAGHLVFGATGGWIDRVDRSAAESYFFALDADSGKELWRINLGGTMAANPMTFSVNGKQMVTMASGGGIFTFALP